ncbi:MAG: cell division ATP-binding protein FtsE [Clostridiales bacterium]|nr:cell division ATP-binding protein FtsE [Clostridiales bacterium]
MIDFINVEKTYASGVEALRGINLTIEDGEFVFVIGKSGSGKSTLLKCITCEERPTSGKVTIDNFDISHMSRALVPHLRRKIGMIYQDFRLIETKTVAENVAFAGEIIGVPKQSLNNTVQICLSVVGLKEKADCYPQELSGGEQQRVAIARAMVNNPSLIVADEPTGNLDPETSEAIMAMLLEINRNGNTTVIICTHDSTMVDRMKQRVIEIEDGLITRDEKDSGYKGDQEHETYQPVAARTSLYGGEIPAQAVSFGDDAEYGDDYDDAEYADTKPAVRPVGVMFGEKNVREYAPVEESFKPEFDLDKAVAPAEDLPEEVITEEVIEEVKTPVADDFTAVKDEPVIKAEPVVKAEPEAEKEPEIKAEPAAKAEDPAESEPEEEEAPVRAEVIEINIPDNTTKFSFGDEEMAAPAIPKQAFDSKPALDPDLDPDESFAYPAEEADNSREVKRAFKRREKEEKAALKEAKRKEKLDKKKKVRRTDFMPGTDIDMIPEDDD